MSLMSKQEALNARTERDGATELDLMRAALVESQERYNQQAAQISLMLQRYDKRIEALERAVEQSNEKRHINLQSALKGASEAILEDMKGKVDTYGAEIEKNIAQLREANQEATKKEASDDRRTEVMIFGTIFATAFVGALLALIAWGTWHDLPAKLDAINNAAYSYTQSVK